MFIVYCLMFNEVVIPLSFILFTLNLKHSALNKNMVVNVYCLMFNEVVIPLSFMLFTLNLKHSALNKNMVLFPL